MYISVIIPAHNEEKTIGDVIAGVQRALKRDFEVIVVNDKSTDNTKEIALKMGAFVIDNMRRYGQTSSLMRGVRRARGGIVATMDADLEHSPDDLPYLLNTLGKFEADVVIGRREKFPRITEILLSLLTKKITRVKDTISGFRVMKKKVFEIADFGERETWGAVFLVKCAKAGLKIVEVPITNPPRRKHTRTGNVLKSNLKVLRCIFFVLPHLFFKKNS